MGGSTRMTSSPPVKRFDWGNLRLRILSAVVLGPATFLVLWFGGWPFLLMVAICALEILVAGIQAYVFALLTSLYLNDAENLH